MRQSQQAEAKARAESEKQRTALMQHMKKLGIDAETFEKDPAAAFEAAANAYFQRKIEEATADPRDLEAKRAKELAEQYQQQLQEFQEQQRQQQETVAVQQRADQYASLIHQALESSQLPRNPKTVARMAELMLAAARNGTQLHPNELAQRVAAQIFDEQSHHLSSFKGDGAAIAKWLGKENVEALRKHLLQEAESKFNTQNTRPRTPEPKPLASKTHKNGYITFDEMLQMSKGRR